jgi:hypothetical protein
VTKKTILASKAARDVLAERFRQISEEGFTPECDDAESKKGELANAAANYIVGSIVVEPVWPFFRFKPTTRRRNLVKAAALIIAEIERLDRAEEKGERS